MQVRLFHHSAEKDCVFSVLSRPYETRECSYCGWSSPVKTKKVIDIKKNLKELRSTRAIFIVHVSALMFLLM